MKAHVITMLVVDHDKVGAAAAAEMMSEACYPNDCISPRVVCCQTLEIGEWHDGHVLNDRRTDVVAWLADHEPAPVEVSNG